MEIMAKLANEAVKKACEILFGGTCSLELRKDGRHFRIDP